MGSRSSLQWPSYSTQRIKLTVKTGELLSFLGLFSLLFSKTSKVFYCCNHCGLCMAMVVFLHAVLLKMLLLSLSCRKAAMVVAYFNILICCLFVYMDKNSYQLKCIIYKYLYHSKFYFMNVKFWSSADCSLQVSCVFQTV